MFKEKKHKLKSFQAGDYSLSEKQMKVLLSGSEGDEYEAVVNRKRSLLSEVSRSFKINVSKEFINRMLLLKSVTQKINVNHPQSQKK